MHSRSALGENRGEETAVFVRLRRLLSHVPLTVRPKVCLRSLRPGLAAGSGMTLYIKEERYGLHFLQDRERGDPVGDGI